MLAVPGINGMAIRDILEPRIANETRGEPPMRIGLRLFYGGSTPG
jgi:hypothetical protein